MDFVLVVLVAVPLLIWAAIHAQTVAEHTNQAWRKAAELLEGTFVAGGTGVLGSGSRRIVANVEGIDVTIDHYSSTSGEKQTTHYTRLRAAARAPLGFRLRVSRAHAFSGLARALGFQDVETGEAGFDRDFVVKTSDPEVARLWLNRRVRKRIRQAAGYAFEIERGKVRAEVARLEKSATDIVRAAHAVAGLADGRSRLLRVWRDVARKHGGTVKPRKKRWATLELELDGVPVTIDTESRAGEHATFASARVVGAAIAPFVLRRSDAGQLEDLSHYVLRSGDREAVLAHVDERARRAIEELGPAEVRAEDGEVIVTWPGISVDRKVIEQASALAAMLASASVRGPYR